MSFIKKIKRGGSTYLAEVKNVRVKGKVVQKYLRYLGKEVNHKRVISISSENIQFDKVKISGPLIVLHALAKKVGLPEVLGNYSDEILSMVYAHCLDYRSVNNMPSWYERTDLNSILNLDGLTERRLFSALDQLNESKAPSLQKRIFENVKKEYKLSSNKIVYDVTNTYFYGSKCQLGNPGYSKDGKRKSPLIQIGLAVTQEEGIPVFHKTFKGNIHDSRTLTALVSSFSEYNLRSGLLVYDRGIASSKNLSHIGGLGWNTLCGIPMREVEKKTVRNFLKSGSIVNVSNRVILNKNTFYVKSMNYTFGQVKGKLAICYNHKRKDTIREARYDEIVAAQNCLSQNKSIKEGLKKYLTPTGKIKDRELKKAEEFDGYSCIFSTKNISGKDMVKFYFDKDVVERAFRILKGVTNLNPVRHWLCNRVVAHVFICYLSYLLLSVLKLHLYNLDISPIQALKELENLYKVYFSDKKKKIQMSRTVALSKIQENIIKAIDKKLLREMKTSSDHF